MESFDASNQSGLVWHTACIPHSSLHFYSVLWLNHRGGRSIITFLHTRPLLLSLQPTARPWPDGCAAREQSAVCLTIAFTDEMTWTWSIKNPFPSGLRLLWQLHIQEERMTLIFHNICTLLFCPLSVWDVIVCLVIYICVCVCLFVCLFVVHFFICRP